jgi:Flp pilus assembly protein TadG
MLGWVRRWLMRREGTTAVEFSLLLWPYITLTFGIIEISLMYASASLLEGATNSAARLIRTGQIQQAEGEDPETIFRESMCAYATALIDCNDVIIEVQQLTSFTDYYDLEPQYDEDGNFQSQGFDAGGSSDRVLVRVGYRYSFMTPLIGTMIGGADSALNFMSTIVLQTEPYDFDDLGG